MVQHLRPTNLPRDVRHRHLGLAEPNHMHSETGTVNINYSHFDQSNLVPAPDHGLRTCRGILRATGLHPTTPKPDIASTARPTLLPHLPHYCAYCLRPDKANYKHINTRRLTFNTYRQEQTLPPLQQGSESRLSGTTRPIKGLPGVKVTDLRQPWYKGIAPCS